MPKPSLSPDFVRFKQHLTDTNQYILKTNIIG